MVILLGENNTSRYEWLAYEPGTKGMESLYREGVLKDRFTPGFIVAKTIEFPVNCN